MKVLYDHQIFTSQNHGGVSRYFYELINNFIKLREGGIDFELSLRYSNNAYIKDAPFSTHKEFFKKNHFRNKHKIINFINKQKSVAILGRQNYDVFHPTYYDPYFLKYIGRKPFVLTIHDMIHEIYPEMFTDETSAWKKLLLQKAGIIIAVSENTKKDILRFYNIDEKKIIVIYHGCSIRENSDSIIQGIGLPDKFILFVGSRVGYKNFDFFIRSISPLLKKDEDLYAVCIGGGKFSKNENLVIEQLNVKNKVFHYSIDSDNALSYFYQKATVFVFPSLYEGFGIPILESFSCGCPVALSNASSFPEIAGDAGIYFNPSDESSIREAVSKIVYGEDKAREDLKFKGLEQLKKFSWEKMAKETIAVYRILL